MKIPPGNTRGYPVLLALTILLVMCVLAYLPGLGGDFLLDDFHNLVDNPALRAIGTSAQNWLALALSSGSGTLRRPISMLSFGIDYRLFGLDPLAFKITNLVIHLANGLLFYRLAQHLVPRLISMREDRQTAISASLVALLATALWLLHPLNVSSVLYVVQRMNLLAGLFTLIGLVCYTEGRERMLRGERGPAIAFATFCLLSVLATLSKENGALIVGYAWIIEVLCYRFAAHEPQQQRTIKAFFWLTLALPIALFCVHLVTHPQWLTNSYAGRDFTLYQRLLSESRTLCDYLLWIFVPLPQWMGIFHDDFAISTGLFTPIQTFASTAFLIALAACAWKLRNRYPGVAFGVAWFVIGHSMESTILPLELVFEHRNYLPMAGLLLGVVCTVAYEIHIFGRIGMALVSAIVIVFFGTLTMTRTVDWSSALRLAKSEALHHPNSSRAQYEAGRQIVFAGIAGHYREEAEERAIPYFMRAKALDATDLYGTSALIMIQGRGGKTIAQEDIADLAHRVKTILQPRINPFLVVLTGAMEGSISLTPEQMSLLVESALGNRAFPPTMRAMILSDYGHYQFQIVHDNQAAVSLTLAAATEDPQNPLFQINLTQLALALGQPDMARAHLENAKALNKVGMYDKTISELGQQLPP